MLRRSESIKKSYDKLVELLNAENRRKLDLITNVNRQFNEEVMLLCEAFCEIFKKFEQSDYPTIQLVCPAYYWLLNRCKSNRDDHPSIKSLKSLLQKSLDEKFWTSVKLYHWLASFLDRNLRDLQFVEQEPKSNFKKNLSEDIKNAILNLSSEIDISGKI